MVLGYDRLFSLVLVTRWRLYRRVKLSAVHIFRRVILWFLEAGKRTSALIHMCS